MFITNTFSIILTYALFATANGAVVHNDLSDALARLEAIEAKVVYAKDGIAPTAVPASESDTLKIVSDGMSLERDMGKPMADLQSDPEADVVSKRNTDTSALALIDLTAPLSVLAELLGTIVGNAPTLPHQIS